MSETANIEPGGEKIRKAVRWVCETVQNTPEKSRRAILREAEIRFDLSPLECEFLDRNLCDEGDSNKR